MSQKTPKITIQASDQNGCAILGIQSDNRSIMIYAREDGSTTVCVSDLSGHELLKLDFPWRVREYGLNEVKVEGDGAS